MIPYGYGVLIGTSATALDRQGGIPPQIDIAKERLAALSKGEPLITGEIIKAPRTESGVSIGGQIKTLLTEAGKTVGGTVGGTVGAAVKPLLVPIVVIGIVVAGIFLASGFSAKRGGLKF